MSHRTLTHHTLRAASFGALLVTIALGAWARAEPASDTPADTEMTATNDSADDEEDIRTNGRFDQRIRAAARRDRIAEPVAEALIRLFSDDVDLKRAAHPGDGFVVVATKVPKRSRSADAGIVFASLTYGGQTRRVYRFVAPASGADYYDESGRSTRKLLVRRPLHGGWLRSSFGARRHPILGTTKFHTGVDWQAPTWTPIYAAGDAAVTTAGWDGEYGKIIRLQHADGYTTAYAHVAAIARGISSGVKVQQGQLIGYVGSTGISTGPHLHYEVLVDGRFVDPVRIRLPSQHVLDGVQLDDFKRERDSVHAAASRDAAFHPLIAQK
jgi:murein DD-endopeptidase MepM/ murein hydrolase activator NlpD